MNETVFHFILQYVKWSSNRQGKMTLAQCRNLKFGLYPKSRHGDVSLSIGYGIVFSRQVSGIFRVLHI